MFDNSMTLSIMFISFYSNQSASKRSINHKSLRTAPYNNNNFLLRVGLSFFREGGGRGLNNLYHRKVLCHLDIISMSSDSEGPLNA